MGPRFTLPQAQWLLAAMLLSLHFPIWWDFGSDMSRSLILAHLGLFFLWQPIWRHDQRMRLKSGIIFFAFIAGFLFFLNWWVLFCWLTILIGLVGGQILINVTQRRAYMLTLLFLVLELLIGCVPNLFDIPADAYISTNLFKYGLLLTPLALLAFRATREDTMTTRPVDFFRGITVALMAALVTFGSLLLMYHSKVTYPVALVQSLLSLAAFLFVLGWLSSPIAGFAGLTQLWERSLMNIGTPFEQWLASLAELAEHESTPVKFVESAVAKLVEMPWIEGIIWRAGAFDGSAGSQSFYKLDFVHPDLEVSVFSTRQFGPTLSIHCSLLVQVLDHFYVSKLREKELAQQAHLQAIYETGARVTHDIKNLLQSLKAVTIALEREYPAAEVPAEGRSVNLLRRQLPHISQRLELALAKLQAPDKTASEWIAVSQWWEALKARKKGGDVRFNATIDQDPLIPRDLFDSVADNLLENTAYKAKLEPQVVTDIELQAEDSTVVLRISDNGSRIEKSIADSLFKQPVPSRSGLGIGLYQASKQAEYLGYQLTLHKNVDGNVCFELSNKEHVETAGRAASG